MLKMVARKANHEKTRTATVTANDIVGRSEELFLFVSENNKQTPDKRVNIHIISERIDRGSSQLLPTAIIIDSTA